jgi:hypothetical protein
MNVLGIPAVMTRIRNLVPNPRGSKIKAERGAKG